MVTAGPLLPRRGGSGGRRDPGRPSLVRGPVPARPGTVPRPVPFAAAAVVEPGQDAGGLLPAAEAVRAAGGCHVLAQAQSVDEFPCGVGGLVVEELPIDHHHRREVAGGVALDVLERDLAVVGGPAVVQVQVVLEGGVDLVAAHDRAQGVGAHPDLVVAPGTAAVHRVEGRDRVDLGHRQVELVGAEGHARLADVPLLRLDQVQQRQQRRPGPGIAGDDVLGVRFQTGDDLVGEPIGPALRCDLVLAHRSTPPITGSILATAAMTSATVPPSHIAATACRCTKEGSRKCTR